VTFLAYELLNGLLLVCAEVFIALVPVCLFLTFLQYTMLRLPRERFLAMVKGLAMAFVGFVVFLQGVHIGFLQAGHEMGSFFGRLDSPWPLIGVGLLLGLVSTLAEPAVRVLASEVERASSGSVRSQIVVWATAVGVGVITSLGMVRLLYGIPIAYLVLPGYLAVFALARWSQPAIVAIAFDAGAVATGPMNVSFVMTLAVGAAMVIEGRDPLTDGLGLIALIALAPVLSVTVVGVLYRSREEGVEQHGRERAAGFDRGHRQERMG
jgi:hypothetical protein